MQVNVQISHTKSYLNLWTRAHCVVGSSVCVCVVFVGVYVYCNFAEPVQNDYHDGCVSEFVESIFHGRVLSAVDITCTVW